MSSNDLRARLLPEPESPETTIILGIATDLGALPCPCREPPRKPPLQEQRCICALRLERVVPGGDLHYYRDVPPRRNRHPHVGERDARDGVSVLVYPQPVVGLLLVPEHELDDQVHRLPRLYRGYPEEVPDVDYPPPAHLHEEFYYLGAAAYKLAAGRLLDNDYVVRNQAVSPDDQLERALALADAGRADYQHADAKYVHQDAVYVRLLPGLLMDGPAYPPGGACLVGAGHQERYSRPVRP